MNNLLEDAARRAIGYLDGLSDRKVAPLPKGMSRLLKLDEPLPEGSTDPETTIKLLDETCSAATMAMAGPRFFGFVIGGSLPVSLAANWLAGAWDQNTAFYKITPSTAMLEQVVLRWILDLFHLPATCQGAFVTGATLANFTCLAAARHAVLKDAGWNVEADGLFGAPPITVVVSEEAHPSLIKSLGLLGMGRSRTIKVPTDDQGRMRLDRFPVISGPTIVCTQAGNVNTGAFDPIGEICEKVHPAKAWVHVDGAFGLWAMTSSSFAELIKGMDQADSWGTDFHKWLNVPYDSGFAIVKDNEALPASMAITAEYLPAPTSFREPGNFVPELSRRARGVEPWAALHSLGRQGVVEMIERNCRQARKFADGFRRAGYEILNDVVLNQVLVSFGDPDRTNRVIAGIQADGTCWCGGTVWHGRTAMRISVSNWSTTDEDVDKSLEAMLRVARS